MSAETSAYASLMQKVDLGDYSITFGAQGITFNRTNIWKNYIASVCGEMSVNPSTETKHHHHGLGTQCYCEEGSF